MTERSARGVPLAVSIALVLLPLLYAGSYALLVDTSGRLEMHDDGICRPRHYRYGGSVAEAVYWPARLVDRQLRSAPELGD